MTIEDTARPEVQLERWESRTGWPLTLAAVVFLVVYAWPILDPAMPAGRQRFLEVVGTVIWVLFAADYLVRVRLARDRRCFVRTHLPDLAVVVLPSLRPLRALRVLAVLGFLNRRSAAAFRGRVVAYVVATVTLLVVVAGLAVLDAERGGGESNIDSIGEAVWWAVTTITSVGYGDHYPTTAEGRLVGAALMLSGIALLGVVTATMASWFIDRARELAVAEERAEVSLTLVLDEVRQLRGELARLTAAQPPQRPD